MIQALSMRCSCVFVKFPAINVLCVWLYLFNLSRYIYFFFSELLPVIIFCVSVFYFFSREETVGIISQYAFYFSTRDSVYCLCQRDAIWDRTIGVISTYLFFHWRRL